jgi:hypothetical protein
MLRTPLTTSFILYDIRFQLLFLEEVYLTYTFREIIQSRSSKKLLKHLFRYSNKECKEM